MSFLNSICGIFNRLARVLTSPFRQLRQSGASLRRLRTANPLTRGVRGIGSSFRRLKQTFRSPKRFLRIPMPRGFTQRFKGLGSNNRYLSEFKESISGLRSGERDEGARKKRKRVAQKAEFSQIHMVHLASGQRTVLHVGTTVGQSQAETTINYGGHSPVRLRFTRVNSQEYDAPILMTRLAGNCSILVEGENIRRTVPLRNQTGLTIDGHQYVCELYAWDISPVVTRVNASWATSVGPVRRHNEDAIGIYQHKDAYLFIIADGVGGGDAGDSISEFAVQYLLAVFHKNIKHKNLQWHSIYEKAFANINAEVRQFADRYAFISGTTLTAVVIKDWDAHVAHVGDSRLYHWHVDTLRQVTVDHRNGAGAEQNGQNGRNQTEESPPERNVLTKAVGKNDTINPDLFTIRLQPGDKLLLCTDGVTNQVAHNELSRFMRSMDAEQMPEHLVNLADEGDNNDNASAVAIDVLREGYEEDTWQAKATDRVYVGYNSFWSLYLKPPQELTTSYPFPSWTALLLLVGLVLIVVFVLGTALAGNTDGEGLETSPTSVDAPLLEPVETPSPTSDSTYNSDLTDVLLYSGTYYSLSENKMESVKG